MARSEDVIRVLNEFLIYSGTEVTPETVVKDNPQMDELTIVDMIMALESEFGIHIYDNDIDSLKTVQDVIDYINREQGEM